MYVYICGCAFTHLSVCVCMCVLIIKEEAVMNLRGRHEWNVELRVHVEAIDSHLISIVYHPLPYFLRFFSETGLTSWLNYLTGEPPGSPRLHLLSAGVSEMGNYVYLAFCICFGDLLSSCLHKKHFTRRGISIAVPPQLF